MADTSQKDWMSRPLTVPLMTGLIVAVVGSFLQIRAAGIERDRAWQQKVLEMKYEIIASAPHNIESSILLLRRLGLLALELNRLHGAANARGQLGLTTNQMQQEFQDLWLKYATLPSMSAEVGRIKAVFKSNDVDDAIASLDIIANKAKRAENLDDLLQVNSNFGGKLGELTLAMLDEVATSNTGILASSKPKKSEVPEIPGTGAGN